MSTMLKARCLLIGAGIFILSGLSPKILASQNATHTDLGRAVSTPTPTQDSTPTSSTTGQVVIEPGNTNKVVYLIRLGKGGFRDAVWSPDGKWIAMAGDIGIWLYSVKDLTTLGKVPEGATYTLLNDTVADVGRLLESPTHHIVSLAWSPDGKTLATANSDRTVCLWDVASGKIIKTLVRHTDWVSSVAFSPDGKTLASGSGDKTVRIWDVASGKNIQTLTRHTDWVSSVAFSPDGKTLASGSEDKTVRLWDVASGEQRKVFTDFNSWVESIAFSPDGKTLAEGNGNGKVRVWNVDSGTLRKTLPGYSNVVSSVDFSPDGKTLVSASVDGSVLLWDIARGRSRPVSGGRAYSAVYSPDGKTLAVNGGSEFDANLSLLDAASGDMLHVLSRDDYNIVKDVVFSADGKTLRAIRGGNPFQEWDVASGKSTNKVFIESSSTGKDIAITPDGKIYARVGLTPDSVEVNAVGSGKTHYWIFGDYRYFEVIVSSPDSKIFASGHNDGVVRLWDVASGNLLQTLMEHPDKEDWDNVESLVFSPDGKTLAVGGGSGKIRLWNVSSGKLIRTLYGPGTSVSSIAYSADGKLLASGSSGWSYHGTGNIERTDKDYTVRLWDVASGKPLHILAGHTNTVRSVAFSPDGKLLASGSDDDTIRLWDVASGKTLNILTGHSMLVWSVAFSPDGKTLASGGWDSTIRLWGIPEP